MEIIFLGKTCKNQIKSVILRQNINNLVEIELKTKKYESKFIEDFAKKGGHQAS